MATKRGYTGQYLDDTGLLFYNARSYDPGIGRFVSADTIVPTAGSLTVTPSDAVATKAWGERGAAANPQALNRYSYVNNNPLGAGDPTGHVGEHDPCRKGCAGTTGGGGGGGGGGPIGSDDHDRRQVDANKRPPPKGERPGGGNGTNTTPPTANQPSGQNKPASSPVGNRHTQIQVQGNEPTIINERPYSGHAQDRMQGRGIPPSVVENTITNGIPTPGKYDNTTRYVDNQNGVAVVTNDLTGNVVTVMHIGRR